MFELVGIALSPEVDEFRVSDTDAIHSSIVQFLVIIPL